jgi:HSP20 family protein
MNLWNTQPTKRKIQLSDFFDLYAREFFSPMLEEKMETFMPKVELDETDQGYIVRAELPGLKEDDIQLTLDDNVLIIEGEKKSERTDNKRNNFRSEFNYGAFYRQVPLRADVDNNKIEATYQNGILSVHLLKRNDGTEKTRRIEINKGVTH